jgi:hypothetical protein
VAFSINFLFLFLMAAAGLGGKEKKNSNQLIDKEAELTNRKQKPLNMTQSLLHK